MLRIRSRILIFTHPGSRIQKLQQKRGVNKNLLSYLFCCHNFTKLNIILFLICWRKKSWPNFPRIIQVYPQKLSLRSQKYGFGIRDPRSGIRKKPIPDPGSRGQKGTGPRIPDPDPQHWKKPIVAKNVPKFSLMCIFSCFGTESRELPEERYD